MPNWDEINCRTDCGLCNHRGTPSSRKGSQYCESLHQGFKPKTENTLLENLKRKFRLKGMMRTMGKPSDDDETE